MYLQMHESLLNPSEVELVSLPVDEFYPESPFLSEEDEPRYVSSSSESDDEDCPSMTGRV